MWVSIPISTVSSSPRHSTRQALLKYTLPLQGYVSDNLCKTFYHYAQLTELQFQRLQILSYKKNHHSLQTEEVLWAQTSKCSSNIAFQRSALNNSHSVQTGLTTILLLLVILLITETSKHLISYANMISACFLFILQKRAFYSLYHSNNTLCINILLFDFQ